MLRWRILLGTLLVAALIGLCWLDHLASVPGAWLLPVAILATLLADQEILRLLTAAGARPLAWPVYCGSLLVVAGNWVPDVCSPALALALALLLVLLGEMYRYEKPGGVSINLAAAVFGIVYVGVMLTFVIQLRLRWGIGALASLLIVVKLGDIGAYTVGRLIGRHKMAPVLSPGKTIEGAIGALLFGCAGAWATFHWLVPLLCSTEPAGMRGGWIIFGLTVAAAGILGDLAESLLKRDAGLKDSSSWLPGFGGVLDILDSILLAAPIAFACWALGLVG